MHFLMLLTVGLVAGVLALEAAFRLACLLCDHPALGSHAGAIAERFDV